MIRLDYNNNNNTVHALALGLANTKTANYNGNDLTNATKGGKRQREMGFAKVHDECANITNRYLIRNYDD